MDVDGTLTDRGICLISSGVAETSEQVTVLEMKVFDSHDGQGLSPAVAKRAEELRVAFVYLGQASKTEAFEECMQKAVVTEQEVAYLGDDLPDIPLAKRAGLGICITSGAPELKAVCHYDAPAWMRFGIGEVAYRVTLCRAACSSFPRARTIGEVT